MSTIGPSHASPLEALPIEIIKRVTSFTTINCTLSLIRCSRFLLDTCYDSIVIRNIIQNKNNIDSPVTESWNLGFLPTTAPISSLVRCALADWKVRLWISTGEIYSGPNLNFLAWAPHLAVLCHPYVKVIESGRFLKNLVSLGPVHTNSQFRSICYIITYRLLHIIRIPSHSATLKDELDNISSGIQSFYHYVPLMIDLLLAVIRSQMQSHGIEFKPPKAEDLPPMKIFSDLLLPFRLWTRDVPGSRDITSQDCLYFLTAGSYFERGEWVGYNIEMNSSFQDERYSSLKDISFRITDTHYMLEVDEIDSSDYSDDDSDRISVSDSVKEYLVQCDGMAFNHGHKLGFKGSGTNGKENLQLTGQVFPGSQVDLTEKGSNTRWSGNSTFWGIVARQKVGNGSVNKWLWLWKQ